MTGPFVPVGILNPIRAFVGIPHHRFNLSVKCASLHCVLSVRFCDGGLRYWSLASAELRCLVDAEPSVGVALTCRR
jgi:hypothetical protein